MSYESQMLEKYNMPSRSLVEHALLIELFKNNGTIKEFGSNETMVENLANHFNLSKEQRSAYLETIYRKENRFKKSILWHRLLFRAADNLAKNRYITRPTTTFKLNNNREWMLTEKGFNEVLNLMNIPLAKKNVLHTKSYEVEKIVRKIEESNRPDNYNPIKNETAKPKITVSKQFRERGFRQAVIEAYDFKCAVCGLKISSPDKLYWEVEAAHIVPYYANGKSDVWNGIALCHLHHWAFDVGWFTIIDDYKVQVSSRLNSLDSEYGFLEDYHFLKSITTKGSSVLLPINKNLYPHPNAIRWHLKNIFVE